MRSFLRLLTALLVLGFLGPDVQANGGFGPGPGIGSFAGGGGVTSGIQVGSGGVLVNTVGGATVNLTCMMVGGLQFGPTRSGSGGPWPGVFAVTTAQWASGIQTWYNTLTTAGKPYGQINCIRLAISEANWLQLTGIDPYNNSGQAGSDYYTVGTDTNGRTVYSAAPSCSGNTACLGTGPGHELAGTGNGYATGVEATVTKILAAGATLGYQMYVILDDQFSTPVWTATGQNLLPIDQPAMPSPAALPMWQQIETLYGNDHRILVEFYNEPCGTVTGANQNGAESLWLGNANGTAATFNFPTTTTSPTTPSAGYNYLGNNCGTAMMGGGGTSGSPNTAQAASFQQLSNYYRGLGGTNVEIIGSLDFDGYPGFWAAAGGTQVYTDTYTIGGVKQSAEAHHSYSYNYGTTAPFIAIQSSGMPIIGTEAGSIVGDSGTEGGVNCGYVCFRSHNWSYTWCCWANYAFPPLSNIYPNDGSAFATNSTILGNDPYLNANVPVGNTGSDMSQVPTGSNLRPGVAIVRLRSYGTNEGYFEQLMTATRIY